MVVVGVEAELVDVERLGPVDVADGDDDELEPEIHDLTWIGVDPGGPWCPFERSRVRARNRKVVAPRAFRADPMSGGVAARPLATP